MKIEEMTISEAQQRLAEADELRKVLGRSPASTATTGSGSHSLTVGEAVLIRTVTHYFTGRIVAITDADIKLGDAAWIADSGRWANALKNDFDDKSEVEPYPDWCIVSRGAIIDVSP